MTDTNTQGKAIGGVNGFYVKHLTVENATAGKELFCVDGLTDWLSLAELEAEAQRRETEGKRLRDEATLIRGAVDIIEMPR